MATEAEIRARRMYENGESVQVIAEMLKCSIEHVEYLRKRQDWHRSAAANHDIYTFAARRRRQWDAGMSEQVVLSMKDLWDLIDPDFDTMEIAR